MGMPDLYFYRDPEDIEKEEQAAAAAEPEETYTTGNDWGAAPDVATGDWSEGPAVTDWSADPVGAVPAATKDWAADPIPKGDDWGAPAVKETGWEATDPGTT